MSDLEGEDMLILQRFGKRPPVVHRALIPLPQHAIDREPTENGICHQDKFDKTSDAEEEGHGAKTIKGSADRSTIPVKDL